MSGKCQGRSKDVSRKCLEIVEELLTAKEVPCNRGGTVKKVLKKYRGSVQEVFKKYGGNVQKVLKSVEEC